MVGNKKGPSHEQQTLYDRMTPDELLAEVAKERAKEKDKKGKSKTIKWFFRQRAGLAAALEKRNLLAQAFPGEDINQVYE